jgi:hypothetical protein
MNNKFLKLTLSSLLSVSLFSSFAFCDETSVDVRVVVGERPMNDEDRTKMKEQREESPIEESTSQDQSNSQGHQNRYQAKAPRMGEKKEFSYSSTSAYAHHWLVSATPDGSIAELEDGSNWKLAPNYSVFNWRVGDSMVITPNHSWLSDYNYYIINKFTGSYVAADLVLGPVAFGPYTHWIIGVDYAAGHVYLENGSTWTIPSNDGYVFKDWAINDTVIIGANDSWLSSYDCILINVNMNNYVRARTY